MPSVSAKQHRFMEAVAHNPAMAKRVGVPQSVGKDFAEADKGMKFPAGKKRRGNGLLSEAIRGAMAKHGATLPEEGV